MTVQNLPDLDNTLVSQKAAQAESVPVPASARRSTVLPRVEWKGDRPTVIPLQRERFEEVRPLGQGGMGEVVLLKDHDIEREVAVKRLGESAELDRVLRFVEEIRTVGQLDHPNIVPLHDVGIDERGRYYFVMKHLQGETLESIIARLKAGDREMHARFPFPARVQLFLGVLNALSYAHRKGFIHRDLKPSNIMVGPFGEVTVMDWGLARQVRAREHAPAAPEAPAATRIQAEREAALLRTQLGAVLGTPLYMSPEQARGEHDTLDGRSDIYSLCVLFHELLFLRHYLEGREALDDILQGVQTVTPPVQELTESPHQPRVPAELGWFIQGGLQKKPAERYPSVDAMMEELQRILSGRIRVRCERTLIKCYLHHALRFVDEHPLLIIFTTTGLVSLVLGLIVHTLLRFLG
ncbi:MAG TPA: serine/threonine-protein kinase [Myxococcaceae bacterium]|jgi:serine/threonine-protein kinase